MIIHLSTLPPTSKHRKVGKTDIIQTFNPFKQFGASEQRFRHYINFCLNNKLRTMGSKFGRNPLSCVNNLSLSSETEVTTKHSPEEYVYEHSQYLVRGSMKKSKALDDHLHAREFVDYVDKSEPTVATVLKAVWEAGGSFADARRYWCDTCKRIASTLEIEGNGHQNHVLGIGQKEFNRVRMRLKELATEFVGRA